SRGRQMKRIRIGVAVLLVNKMLKVTVYVVPLTIGKAPYDVVVACMNSKLTPALLEKPNQRFSSRGHVPIGAPLSGEPFPEGGAHAKS
ncbi:MAG: hypothetical protein M0Z75_16120, partial [Nitrospiraceae bacterium]|nr:hypothetical protein [Nitrospiraceae bacterium]